MNPYYFHPMPKTSRRKFITGMAVLGAASLVRGSTNLIPASASQPSSDSSWSADDRKAASDQLLDYFGKTAPRLLRPAEGTLSHSSIACSLPGKQYSTNLWDWDTYWTALGLFRFAAISKDLAFRKNVGDHAIGSFTNFF